MRRAEKDSKTARPRQSKETEKMNHAKPFTRARHVLALCALAACAALLATAPAQGAIEINSFDVEYTDENGAPVTQAGSHPFAATIALEVASEESGFFEFTPSAAARDTIVEQQQGFVGNTTAVPRCRDLDFVQVEDYENFSIRTGCPDATVVGIAAVSVLGPIGWFTVPIYNLTPPPGVAARIGLVVDGVSVITDITAEDGDGYNLIGKVDDASQLVEFYGIKAQLWGDPSDPAHDMVRGKCGNQVLFAIGLTVEKVAFGPGTDAPAGGCPVGALDKPFLTMPGTCAGPLETNWEIDSWQETGNFTSGTVVNHDDSEPPQPLTLAGCGRLGFDPLVEAKPTTGQAESGTGLDVDISFANEGLDSHDGLAESTTKRAEVTLPEGVTINPSVGEGLEVCTPADLARETADSAFGEGCPTGSRVGTLAAEFPIADEAAAGSIYLAQQDDPATAEPGAENPFDSLIALYFVLKNAKLGVSVKMPVLVEPDPATGQLVATVDDIPQFPFSHFNAHLRTGQRAALVTPATCGIYTTETVLTPWASPDKPRTVLSVFEITEGVGGGPCPPGGVPPFEPEFEAGSINNNAGSFSPFVMRLLRRDGDQDLTKFSSVLPPGVLGSLAGIGKCPDAAVGVAKAKTGRQEQADPSCPANSEIGSTLAGAGVGSALTYVPGKIYLAGPYKGAPLSVVSITPAVAGPFDAGTVAVRLGLDLNPVTAEVEVDGAASDPIPHILKGIVLKLRDLRVHVDRPNFTLNPTSCDESSAKARIFGSFIDVFDPGDDRPVDLSTRYQAANCLNLGFAPKLGLKLKGGTRRGNFPGLKAHYRPFAGHANVKDLVVRLPRSAFLEQGHIRTICTRVQFAADNCPKAAQYGYIRAWTPLLDEPLQGPVWLRSSNHKLPDLVFDLHGLVDVEVQTRIDSVRGGIRARVENAPDAPLSRVILNMQGGKKGLIVNSRNLCTKRKGRANARFTGQNGKQFARKPVLRPQCARKAKRSSHSRVSRVAGGSVAG